MTAALLVLLGKLDPLSDKTAEGSTPLGKKVFNPKGLLRQLSIKYDEYAEATQQDSHELLRHMIDGIMMEEQDVRASSSPWTMIRF
jgi:ubiquitin C-terminal hydrolase